MHYEYLWIISLDESGFRPLRENKVQILVLLFNVLNKLRSFDEVVSSKSGRRILGDRNVSGILRILLSSQWVLVLQQWRGSKRGDTTTFLCFTSLISWVLLGEDRSTNGRKTLVLFDGGNSIGLGSSYASYLVLRFLFFNSSSGGFRDVLTSPFRSRGVW